MVPGYASPIGAHDTLVVVDDLAARSPNLVAGANRDGVPPAQRQRGARLHAGRGGRHHQRPRRATPARTAASRCALRQRHRGRQHLQAGHRLHRDARRHLPGRGRQPALRSSWALRHRRWGAPWPASSRSITTSAASSGRRRWRRYAAQLVALGAAQRSGRAARRPTASTSAWPTPASRCCTTTATSRPA